MITTSPRILPRLKQVQTSPPGLYLPKKCDTLLLKAAIHPDQRGLEAWQCLRLQFSVDTAHQGQLSLLPLVHRTLCTTDAPDPDRQRLAGQRRFHWARWARMAPVIKAALHRLREASIPLMLIGDIATAEQLDGGDQSLRSLPTIELLIHPADWDRATSLLKTTDPIRLRVIPCDRMAVSAAAVDPSWELAEHSTLLGCPVLRPCATDLLLHILVQGTRFTNEARIRWAADAIQLIRAAPINWQRLSDQAVRRRVAITTATSLAYLVSALEVPLPPEAPSRLPAGSGHQRERLINALWRDSAAGPSRRNAVVLLLAQSAAQPPLVSLGGLGRWVCGIAVTKALRAGR